MSIRFKIILLITFIFLGLTGTVFFFTQRQVETSFDTFEQQNMAAVSKMVMDAYANEMNTLVRYAEEIARSKRTRAFLKISVTDNAYPLLTNSEVLKQHVSFFAVSDDRGKILLARRMDAEQALLTDPSEAMLTFIHQDSRLRTHHFTGSVVKGVTVIQGNPLMIVSVPILPEKKGGLIQGAIVLARDWRDSEFTRLANDNKMTLFQQQPGPDLTPDMKAFFEATNKQVGARKTRLFGTAGIGTYVTLADIYNEPGVVIRLTKQKQSGQAGRTCAEKIVTVTSVIGGILFLIAVVLLEVTVQQRLRKLVNEVKLLKSRDRLSEAEITVRGRDEIGKIAHGLRFILDSMKTNRYRWMRTEKRLQDVLEFSPMGTILAKPESHKLYRVNDAVIQTTGYTKRELTGKTLDTIFLTLGGKHQVAALDELSDDNIHKMAGVIKCLDGRHLPVTARVGSIKQADDDLLLITFTVDDTIKGPDGEKES